MRTLGAATFVWNAIAQDYCVIESLECLHELCDSVSIVFGGTDGTVDLVLDWLSHKKGKTLHWLIISEDEWNAQQGREKLSYFSNIAISLLKTDWVYYQQADEVMHESYFPIIRNVIDVTNEDAYFISRLNLWATSYTMLEVPQNRKPVSTVICRLFKNGQNYGCVDDAESVNAPARHHLLVNQYHLGFVRDKEKHLHKIRHMQKDVFLMDYDKRADLYPEFRPWSWGFTPKDIIPIPDQSPPKFVTKWAEERCYPAFREDEYELAKEFLIHINCDMASIKMLRYPEQSLVKMANNQMRYIAELKGCINTPTQ
jgi:hypothetical protein